MSEYAGVDTALDRLDETVSDLTTSTSVAALRRISHAAREQQASREAVERMHEITALCAAAQAALSTGLEHIDADEDDRAVSLFDHALAHLETAADMIDTHFEDKPARRRIPTATYS